MSITLEEALRQGIVKIGDYVDYRPKLGRCVLTGEQTGWKEDQKFETEELGWRLDKFQGDLVLIASKPTSALWLQGGTGYKEGLLAMDTLCRSAYSNPHFSKKVIPMTEEMQKEIGRKYVTRESYWLGSAAVVTCYDYACWGFGYVDGSVVDVVYANSRPLVSPYSDELNGCYGVRPAVYLKSKIQLKEGSGTKSDPWKLIGTEEKVD